jgi:Gpi18-like mannosyltransferase
MKKIFLLFVFWLLLTLLINKLSVNLIPDRTSYELPFKVPATFTIAPFLNMDGRHYLDIACNGYFIKGGFDLRVFFPIYPLLIRAFSLNCILNPVIVGLLISAISFLASLYLLARMLSKDIRFKTLLLLIFFPTSFFFAAYYTEGVFFLFVVLTFWFLEKKKFLAASIFAAIASATRFPGIALAPVLLYEAYLVYKKTKKLRLEVLLAPLGLVLYSVYNWISTGKPLTFISTQTYWDRPVGLLAPFFALKSQITSVVSGPLSSYDSPFVYPIILIEFATLLFLVFILYFSFKSIKKSWWIYMFTNLVIILFGGILSASPRYTLVLFPAYVFLAKRLSGIKYIIYLICSLVLFVFMASLFLRGYWSS